jgi:hypothetical protein
MKLTKQRIKEIIKEELEGMKEETAESPIQEGFNPEDTMLILDAVQKLVMSPYTGPMIIAAFAMVGLEGIRDMLSRRGGSDDVE